MLTRRSPRNQEILWRALAGPMPAAHVVDVDTLESLRRELATPFLSARTRRAIERDIARETLRRAVSAVALAEESK